MHVYMMVMILAVTFLHDKQDAYILITLILIGSFLLFYKYHYNSPFHNEFVAKLWATLFAINLWTAILLLFAKLMEGIIFDGIIVAWIIGIPFVALVTITKRDQRMDLLLLDTSKMSKPEQIQQQIRYLLKLLSWHNSSRNASIMLDGFIELHKAN